MYDKILKEITATEYYQQKFSNDGQRFIAWYLRNILLRDMNETHDDITDGSNDKQIDALIVDDEKSVVRIVQGKFTQGTVDAEPLREVLSSWLQIKDLVRLQNVANQKLSRKLDELASALEEDYEVSFELLTTGTLTDAALHDLQTFQEKLAKFSENEGFDAAIHVIDADELHQRYNYALEADNPSINHELSLVGVEYMHHDIAGTPVLIAMLPLKECIKLPGIKDGTLFQKNVRQSLGKNNSVNKGIRNTILGDKRSDFFFFHNGVTALCQSMNRDGDILKLTGLSVVNGCQSLNTILSCSETVKKADDAFILFRFYEIPQRDRADKISTSTNSQSAVKARDIRSNDRRILDIKRAYESHYPTGYFITKRGERPPADRDEKHVVDLSRFAKILIAWQTLRPNLSYSETTIFDKNFEILFRKRIYLPEDIFALNEWMREVEETWVPKNPLSLNESLLALKSLAPYHHLYAIAKIFAISSNNPDRVPIAGKSLESAKQNNMVEEIVKISGSCLNMALEAAANEVQPANRVFSPQNWVKSKGCLVKIDFAIRNYLTMMTSMPGGVETKKRLDEATALPVEAFEDRLSAD